jgi:hypothetical protein
MRYGSSEVGEQCVGKQNGYFARLRMQFRRDATPNRGLRQLLLRLNVSRHDEYNQRRKFQ